MIAIVSTHGEFMILACSTVKRIAHKTKCDTAYKKHRWFRSTKYTSALNLPCVEAYLGQGGGTGGHGTDGRQGAPAVFWICSLRMRILCLCSAGSMAIWSGVSWSTCMIRAA